MLNFAKLTGSGAVMSAWPSTQLSHQPHNRKYNSVLRLRPVERGGAKKGAGASCCETSPKERAKLRGFVVCASPGEERRTLDRGAPHEHTRPIKNTTGAVFRLCNSYVYF